VSGIDQPQGNWDRLQLVLIVLVWPRVIAPLVLPTKRIPPLAQLNRDENLY
jgi:hypothetical protein